MGFCFDIIAVNPKFHHQKCEDVTDVLINEWRLEGEGMLANDGLLYPSKIPSDFQECPFKISMSHHKLPEVSNMTAFSKRYNFTPIIPFKNKTDTFLSRAINESMKNALLGSSEAFIGGTPLLIEAMHFGEPSFPYHESQYVWYVPSSRLLFCLLVVSSIFSVLHWIVVVAMMILVPAIMWPLSNCFLEYQSQERMSNAFYNMWVICMGVLVTDIPQTFRLTALTLR